ncbi:MAG: aminotransferase class I/II-fold pyridoxal phosphate-dependent enzyme [Candidatus Riflebacteria bacterium]|nr:aminotransferase class I/II-fold pyridoxal phosphate-dependent enzyme [Candidatus Riflebacteria bacterium]
MSFEKRTIAVLEEALNSLDEGFSDLPPFEPSVDVDQVRSCLAEVARRMRNNYPYHHPFYLGQMLKPPHPVARAAYALSLWINPNNHALDGGRCSSAMEKEAVAEIARMFGWETHLGHLTGGGTLANLEALWVSGKLHPGRAIVASEQAHYTHARISGVLGIPFREVACDGSGRMSLPALRAIVEECDVGTVVVTVGTTATGAVDPLPEVLALGQRHGFRVHVDGAYGGYFRLADNLAPGTRATYDRLAHADSIVVDPHKHGLQPYGCGCVLFRDPAIGRFYKHESPYTYFTSSDLHLGEISLECSRAGASAVALWATQRALPLAAGGQFARELARCRQAALELVLRLQADGRHVVPFPPELDIVVFAPRARSASRVSRLTEALFHETAREGLHLAKAVLPRSLFADAWPDLAWDEDHLTSLRTCLMKPEHLDWLGTIWETYRAVADRVLDER